jgi:hypothetical protein
MDVDVSELENVRSTIASGHHDIGHDVCQVCLLYFLFQFIP